MNDYNSGVPAADVLLSRLKAAGVRPVALAKALGVSKQQASLILSGKGGIAIWHLDAVAAMLGTSVPDLFVEVAQQSSSQELARSETIRASGPAVEGDSYARSPSALAEDLITVAATLTDIAARLLERMDHVPVHPAREDDPAAPTGRLRRRRLAG